MNGSVFYERSRYSSFKSRECDKRFHFEWCSPVEDPFSAQSISLHIGMINLLDWKWFSLKGNAIHRFFSACREVFFEIYLETVNILWWIVWSVPGRKTCSVSKTSGRLFSIHDFRNFFQQKTLFCQLLGIMYTGQAREYLRSFVFV